MIRENRDGLEKKAQREEEAGDVTQCGKSFLLADFNLTTSNSNLINASVKLVLLKLRDMSFFGAANLTRSRLLLRVDCNTLVSSTSFFSIFALKVIDTNLVGSCCRCFSARCYTFTRSRYFFLFFFFFAFSDAWQKPKVYLRVIVFKLTSYFPLEERDYFTGYKLFTSEYFAFHEEAKINFIINFHLKSPNLTRWRMFFGNSSTISSTQDWIFPIFDHLMSSWFNKINCHRAYE